MNFVVFYYQLFFNKMCAQMICYARLRTEMQFLSLYKKSNDCFLFNNPLTY